MKTTAAIEPLETRIAPAAVFTYIDADGDDVTLKTSKGTLADLEAAGVLTFSSADQAAPRQLQRIDLSADVDFEGTDLIITAKRNATRGGDGFADVGYLDATGRDLGAVSVAGDLGRIDAGRTTSVSISAIRSLSVQSMGELGTSTQAPGGTLASTITGPLGGLHVNGNLRDVRLTFTDDGGIGSATIGGSVLGASITGRGIGVLEIGGDLRGGNLQDSGEIRTTGTIGSVTIGGSLVGTVANTANLVAASFRTVEIAGDLRGAAMRTAQVLAFGEVDSFLAPAGIGSLVIGGSVIGGSGSFSGLITAADGRSRISIAGDLRGGSSTSAGGISAASVDLLTIGGSIFGGSGTDSAAISADAIDALLIGGSVRGGEGSTSGRVFAVHTIASAEIGGSLVGGGGGRSGSLQVTLGSLGTVEVAGSLLGGAGGSSGQIFAGGAITSATIGGSLVGAAGSFSGGIFSDTAIGSVRVAGDLRGGAGSESATISAIGDIASITIGGSVLGGTSATAVISSGATIDRITIGGRVEGSAAVPVRFTALGDAADPRGFGSVAIGGNVQFFQLLAGYVGINPLAGDAQIGSVSVGGDWIASSIAAGVDDGADNLFGTADDQVIAAGNTASIVSRIGSVSIKGQALGTPGGTDAFGIVAEEVSSVKVGAVAETLTVGAVDAVPLGATLDFIVREDVVGADAVLPTLSGTPDSTVIKIVSPTLATWIDVDGDLVTFKTTKPILSDDDFLFIGSGAGVQVQTIDWSGDESAAVQGVGVTITAKPQDLNGDGILDGDGSVNIGSLRASGIDLGAVKIAGDLGALSSGDTSPDDVALKSLTVQSVGAFGTSTLPAGSKLSWSIRGSVPAITVRGDVAFADIGINGTGDGLTLDNAALGKLTIGGSLRGGETVANGGLGTIGATGRIGSVTIGGDVLGAAGANSGQISSLGAIGKVTVGGSVIGGAGEDSGQIAAVNGIASVKIGRDIRGGGAEAAGAIDGGLSLGAVTIGGSMVGGAGEESGSVFAETLGGFIKSVKIGGDIRGGAGTESAYLHAEQKLGSVSVAGSLSSTPSCNSRTAR